MIDLLTKVATSPNLSSIAQSTVNQVAIETTLKAIGRPGFILIDNDIDPDTKKYAAAKEFLYQATCLAVYLALVIPVFKKGSFKLAKKILKDVPEFEKFKNLKHYEHYLKLCDTTPKNRVLTLGKEIKGKMIKTPEGTQRRMLVSDDYCDDLVNELKNKKEPNRFNMVKGAVELGSIVGSVFGLAILAPQVSHAFIHPALRFLGMEEKKTSNPHVNNEQPKLDKQV